MGIYNLLLFKTAIFKTAIYGFNGIYILKVILLSRLQIQDSKLLAAGNALKAFRPRALKYFRCVEAPWKLHQADLKQPLCGFEALL